MDKVFTLFLRNFELAMPISISLKYHPSLGAFQVSSVIFHITGFKFHLQIMQILLAFWTYIQWIGKKLDNIW